MFERMLAPRRRGAWPVVVIGVSVAVHALVGVGLLIKSAWAIDKLPLEIPSSEVAFRGSSPPPGPSEAKPADLEPLEKPKREVKDVVQPDDDEPPPDETADATDTATADRNGPGLDGPPNGIGIGPPGPPGQCTSALCKELDDSPPPPPPKPESEPEPRMVPNTALTRTGGETQIPPSDQVVGDMSRTGVEQVVAVAKVCLDTQGNVASVTIVRSSGYPSYDRRLRSKIRAWRYAPQTVNGTAVPVCTLVRFVFRLR